MLEEYVIKKILDSAYDAAKKVLKESGSKLLATKNDIEQSINHHLRSVKNWSAEISFNDLKKAKYTTDIFIELDLYVYPRRIRIQSREIIQRIPLNNIFDYNIGHFVLLGQPGAGKTTSMKYLCQLLFIDEDFYSDRFTFPILIKFRDLNSIRHTPGSSIIIDQVYNILGLKIDIPEELQKSEFATEIKNIKERLVISILEELHVLLMLDGFDELAQVKYREEVINEISNIASHLENSTMIVTSRSGDFVYNINNTNQYEICPLSKEQMSKFANKWLNDVQKASEFLTKVYDSPFADTAIRPLTLAHLCAIYERIGKIPDKPKTIYRKIVNLLLEEWDQQRSVKRVSRYANFEVDRKFEFMCHLAYILTTSLQKTVFTNDDLLEVYKSIYFDYDLVSHEAKQVVSELETHTGLLLQSGYEQYEFAHKSLQEYLTAEYLVKLPNIPTDEKILSKLPNELAIAITISSSPTDYFSELILKRFVNFPLTEDFGKSFLSRLILEKPDFNTSFKVGLSLVLLYTLYIEWNFLDKNHLKLLNSDDLMGEYEKVVKLVLRKNSMAIIRSNYETSYIYEMEDGDHLIVMKRKKEVDGLLLKLAVSFPRTIYIRSSLLEGLNNQDED